MSGKAAAPGQAGEIVAQSENITLGYWCDEDETKASFRQGNFHNGDIERMASSVQLIGPSTS